MASTLGERIDTSIENDRGSGRRLPRDLYNAGRKRGVVNAQRKVAPESRPALSAIQAAVGLALAHEAEPCKSKRFHATVFGSYRFTAQHYLEGPPTDLITDRIESSGRYLKAYMGGIVVLRTKLAVELVCDDLEEEARLYEKEFLNEGANPGEYPDDGQYHPHCSLFTIDFNSSWELKDPEQTALLNQAFYDSSAATKAIWLKPIQRYHETAPVSEYMPQVIASNGLAGCWSRQTAAAAPVLAI